MAHCMFCCLLLTVFPTSSVVESNWFLNQKIKVRGMGSSMTESFPPLQEVMLEFRAGRMFTEGTRVIPDTRKGLVRIGRGEEGLVHFQWLDRTHNVVEDDQIVFPDEAVFEKVNQSSERVYILKFSTDSRRFFYWMQDPKSDGDTQICSSVNYYINQSLDLVGEEDVATSVPQQISDMAEDMAEDDISRDGNLAEQHSATELISEVNSSSGLVQLEDLQRILSNISAPDAAVEDQDGGLGLNDILKPDLLMPLLETLPLEQRLVSHLPEGPWTPADFIELLQSPPFRQQVEAFTYVLRTGQIDLSQFGIDPSKYKFTVLSFLEALEDSVSKAMESGEAESRPDENNDLPSQRCSGSDPMDESQ